MTENATAARRISPCVSEDRGDHCTPGMPFRCNGCMTADAFTALLDEHDCQRDAALAAVAEFSAKALQAAFDDLARARETVETLRAERDALANAPERRAALEWLRSMSRESQEAAAFYADLQGANDCARLAEGAAERLRDHMTLHTIPPACVVCRGADPQCPAYPPTADEAGGAK